MKVRWIDFLYKLATSSKGARTLLTPAGAVLFGIFTALFVLSALALDKWFGFPAVVPRPIRLYIAAPIIVLGTSVSSWSMIHFLKANGTPVPVNPPSRLVITGPYAHTRNPMLTGIFILLFGIGTMLGSMSLIFIFTPLFILVNAWELKEIEEPELVRRLGEEYIAYRIKTPMFIPKLKTFEKKNTK